MLKVAGSEVRPIYSGKEVDEVYLGSQAPEGEASRKETARIQEELRKETEQNPRIRALTKEMRIQKGKQLYLEKCSACHQPTGLGLAPIFPPLAKSDYLMHDKERSIKNVINGLSDRITVNGVTYNAPGAPPSVMPPNILTDEEVASILTFVRNSWGNKGDMVTPEEVAKIRSE